VIAIDDCGILVALTGMMEDNSQGAKQGWIRTRLVTQCSVDGRFWNSVWMLSPSGDPLFSIVGGLLLLLFSRSTHDTTDQRGRKFMLLRV
jgi:hypothetical protein